MPRFGSLKSLHCTGLPPYFDFQLICNARELSTERFFSAFITFVYDFGFICPFSLIDVDYIPVPNYSLHSNSALVLKLDFTFLEPYLLPVTKNKKIVYLPILVVSFDLYLSRSASQCLDTTDPLCHHCFRYVLAYSLASFDYFFSAFGGGEGRGKVGGENAYF